MKINLKENKTQRLAAISVLGSLLIVSVIVIAGVSYAYAYNDRFFPGSIVATVPLGGLSYESGLTAVNTRVDALIQEGASITINGETRTIPLQILSPSDPDLTQDLVTLDVALSVQDAFNKGRTRNLFVRAWDMAFLGLVRPSMPIHVETNREAIESNLLKTFEDYYNPAQEPTFTITHVDDVWDVQVVEGHSGRAFNVDDAIHAFTSMMTQLNNSEVRIALVDEDPQITTEQASARVDQVMAVLEAAPFDFIYEPSRFESFSYSLEAVDLADTLQLERTADDRIALSVPDSLPLFETMTQDINIDARNARFVMENDRVQEFTPSIEGRAVNTDAVRLALIDRLSTFTPISSVVPSNEPIAISVERTEADITTNEVNDLGISEIIGVGVSDFHNSPANRIANIKHGMSKLNGMLIAPGEETSLLEHLRPFTIADGYLPELVIKGDEIIPEVAGGLCQIGSTAFRAVMNSGLTITSRRNHSLVVSYYNDLTNGNPGTDATLYDPAPDFKFINDTGHYILLNTEMDMATSKLYFTFWGTNDGRKGYYSPPVVLNWSSAGPAVTTYTTSLAPGVKRCQSAHPGANTTFNYFVERPDGTVEKTVYESHYRALPASCLVGVAADRLDPDGNLIPESVEPAPETPIIDAPVEEPIAVE